MGKKALQNMAKNTVLPIFFRKEQIDKVARFCIMVVLDKFRWKGGRRFT